MPLGISAKSFGTNLKIAQSHFRIIPKQYPGEIVMYRYLSCLIILVETTTASAQTPIPASATPALPAPINLVTTASHSNLIQTKSSSKNLAAIASQDSINLTTTVSA